MNLIKLTRLWYLVRLNNNSLTKVKVVKKCIVNRFIKRKNDNMKMMTMKINAVKV